MKVFSVPIIGGDEANEELNKYLRGNRVVSVDKQLCTQEGVAYWTFCVVVAEGAPLHGVPGTGEKRDRIDYREVLDEKCFAVFSRLRAIRKQLATEDAVPAYAVFTDAELAELARLDVLDEKSVSSIPGIGAKRLEKYGLEMIHRYNDEAGQP